MPGKAYVSIHVVIRDLRFLGDANHPKIPVRVDRLVDDVHEVERGVRGVSKPSVGVSS